MAKSEPENKPSAAKSEADKPKATKLYKVLVSVLFGHRILTFGSKEPFTESEAAILLNRGVIKAISEGK